MLVGLIFLVGLYPLMMYLWPSGWRWQPHQLQYEQMIQKMGTAAANQRSGAFLYVRDEK